MWPDIGEGDSKRLPVEVEFQGTPPPIEMNADDGSLAPLHVGVDPVVFAVVVDESLI